jgi:hypothetical protein
MVVLPDSAKEALRGINQDLSNNEPYVTLLNSSADSTPTWVIPVAKSACVNGTGTEPLRKSLRTQ